MYWTLGLFWVWLVATASCQPKPTVEPLPEPKTESVGTRETTQKELPQSPDEHNPALPDASSETAPDAHGDTPTEPSQDNNRDNPLPEPQYPNRIPTVVTFAKTTDKLIANTYLFHKDGTLTSGPRLTLPLEKYRYKPNGKVIATLDGDELYLVRFETDKGPFILERYKLFGLQKKQTHTLTDRRPTALFARGGHLYVGGVEKTLTRVDTIDFHQTPPQYKQRYTAKESFRQEIDEFAITGNTLIAIDDVIVPKFGFVFSIGINGSFGKHLFTNHLPVTIDGAYAEGVARGNQLYLREQFDNGHGHGKGQTLLRLTMVDKAFREDASIAEYVPAEITPDSQPRLLHGTEFTVFQGMVMLGRHLLIGAGTRGILAMPDGFNDKDANKAIRVDIEGACTDIIDVDGRIFALLQRAETTILARLHIDPSSGKIAIRDEHELANRPTRFPR